MMSDTLPGASHNAIGLWQRTSFAVGDGPEDRTTTVFWGQTAILYVDLRVPAGRPTCRLQDLVALTDQDLQALGRQQGFAGRLVGDRDRFTWHRDIDFQPNTGRPDTGLVRIDGEMLYETGDAAVPGTTYAEVFERVASGAKRRVALRLVESDKLTASDGTLPSLYLVIIDDHFLIARARPEVLPEGPALGPMLAEARRGNAERVPALLDCEISKGCLGAADRRWIIDLSTHPWREGRAAFEVGRTELEGDTLTCHAPSARMTWVIEDSNLAAVDLAQLFSPDEG